MFSKAVAKKGLGEGRYLPEGTSARHVDKPRVDTLWVELMVAWEDPQVLALDEVIGTDGAGEVTSIRSSIGI